MRYLGVAVTLLVLVSCSNDPNVAKAKYLSIGNKYFDRGRYREASIYYRKALAKDPKYGEAYYGFALALIKQGQLGNAVGPLRRAVELLPSGQPNSDDAKLRLSEILLMVATAFPSQESAKPWLEEADQLGNSLLRRNPNSFEGHRILADLTFTKGLLFVRTNRLVQWKISLAIAISEYRKALALRPEDTDVMNLLARTLNFDGQPAEAERLYKAVIARNKTFLPAYKDLYRLYIARAKSNPDAEKVLKDDIANNPNDYPAQADLAEFYLAAKRSQDMEDVLNRLTAHVKEYPEAYLMAADLYVRSGDPNRAVRELQEASEKDPPRKLEYEKRILHIYLRQGKRDGAYQQILQILKQSPQDVDARTSKAMLLLEKGDANEAAKELQSLLANNPENIEARYNLGRALAAKGEIDEARKQFQRAINFGGGYAPARLALARLDLNTGDYESALFGAQEFEKVNKSDTSAQLVEAAALLKLQRYAESRAILDRLLAAHPNHADALRETGDLDIAEKRYKQALDAYRAAWEVAPYNVQALMGMSTALVALGQTDQAFELLASEVKKHPDNLDLRREAANFEVRQGRYDQAVVDYQTLLEKSKGSPRKYADALYLIGMAYHQKGDSARAISYLRKAQDQAPDNVQILSQLAAALEAAGQDKDAMDTYRKVIQNDPNNAGALNNLAYLLAQTGGDLNEALTLANRARQSSPRMWEISDTIGWIYIKKNLSDSAVDVLRDLIEHIPQNPTYHYHLALALLQKGDKAQALKEAQLALERKPSNEERERIQEMLQKMDVLQSRSMASWSH